jgi:general secretion pathway protein C
VDRIDETRISIDRGGGWREVLDLISSPAVTAPGISPAAADGDGVTKIGEHSYCVRRAALDSWLSDPAALMTAAVIVPEARDGKPTAIRLVRIRPGSVLERIGLRGGDLIRAVNGLELATPDGALQAFLKLRSSAHIAVSIERGGQPLTQEYSIE